MTLTDLLASIHIVCDDERIILGISDDTRRIQKDWLFIVRDGVQKKGNDFIEDAIKKGAIILQEGFVCEGNIYGCENIEAVLPVLLATFYRSPWKHLCMIGVTGTNGKSSVTNISKQLLVRHDYQVMTIGTGEITYQNQCIEIDNTTPSIFLLLEYLSMAVSLGMDMVIMEISSHAIDQHRIRGIFYDYIIYTNITQDHLDYHITKTHYQYTKFKLRNALKEQGVIIVNNDDPVLENLYSLSYHKIITCGSKQAHYALREIQLYDNLSSFQLHTYTFYTPLLSYVNIYNICEALIVCRCLGIPYEQLQDDVAQLQPVAGRLQCLTSKSRTIWIDYAHTFMAVKTLIDFANSVKKNRVILVVGCGGERELEKRKQIGKYAQEHCDITILTTDNPRGEDPSQIIQEMLPKPHNHIQVIENRWYAIKHAIKIASNSDIIIIAGKGNENTQSFRGREYPFHDINCVYEILQREELF